MQESEEQDKSEILISVLACTYKRPDKLQILLNALAAQEPSTPSFEVCIVDNDSAESARAVVEAFAEQAAFPVHYEIEPEQNIAHARNRTVKLSSGTWIAMIDDDEVPEPNWLLNFHKAAIELGADALFAPVVPGLPDCTPEWLRRGRLHDRPRHKTGTVIPENETRAGNVFIRASLLKKTDQPFDPAFGRSGGEDVRAFEELRRTGAKMLWCDEAPVVEDLPPERVTLDYMRQRSYWGAQTYARLVMAKYPSGTFAYYLACGSLGVKSAAQLVISALMVGVYSPISEERCYYWLCKVSAQWGKLTALGGGVHIAYG